MWLLIAGCLTVWFVAAGFFGVTFGRVVRLRDLREGPSGGPVRAVLMSGDASTVRAVDGPWMR